MFLTILLLLTKFSLMGGIFIKIYFGLGFFMACLEMIAINTETNNFNKIKGFDKIEITFSQKVLQFLMVLLFIPQHLLLISCWFIYNIYGSNEEFKS